MNEHKFAFFCMLSGILMLFLLHQPLAAFERVVSFFHMDSMMYEQSDF